MSIAADSAVGFPIRTGLTISVIVLQRIDFHSFNSIWPLTIIATAAVQNLLGGDDSIARSRTPEIMADAAYAVLTSDPKQITGYYFLDEPTLRAIGVSDFVKYRVNKKVDDEEMGLDFFI